MPEWIPVFDLQFGPPFRPSEMRFRVFTASALVRVEYYSPKTKRWHLWKLDDVHEALILLAIRNEVRLCKSEIHNARLHGKTDTEKTAESRLHLLRRAQEMIGARKHPPLQEAL